jgi:hypothetical protein
MPLKTYTKTLQNKRKIAIANKMLESLSEGGLRGSISSKLMSALSPAHLLLVNENLHGDFLFEQLSGQV